MLFGLFTQYVGESERAVRQCFQRARNSAPCVIFFDEFDSLCPKRSDTAEGSAGTRVVNQLLTEMDGIEERKGVFLMAATNRPDIVDPAVLRPGRLDKILYVGLPAKEDRVDILRALTKNRTQPRLADDVELEKVAELTEGYTGADLAGLVRQASLQTLKDSIVASSLQEETAGGETIAEDELSLMVRFEHFTQAIRNIKPSVNAEVRLLLLASSAAKCHKHHAMFIIENNEHIRGSLMVIADTQCKCVMTCWLLAVHSAAKCHCFNHQHSVMIEAKLKSAHVHN